MTSRRWPAALALALPLIFVAQHATADPIAPFLRVNVNGEFHDVPLVVGSCHFLVPCASGGIHLELDSGSVGVSAFMSQGVSPRAPEYAYNSGGWSIRLRIDATNLGSEPLSIVAWAGTPISPLFVFPNCCELIPTQDALYYTYLNGVLVPGSDAPGGVTLVPLFPDLDGDGQPEIFNALAARSDGGPFENLGVDIGGAITGAGRFNVFSGPPDVAHIDPNWVFLSSALAFTLSGDGDAVSLVGDAIISPTIAPEPAILPLLGVGLSIAGLWRRRGRVACQSNVSASTTSSTEK